MGYLVAVGEFESFQMNIEFEHIVSYKNSSIDLE